MRWYKPVQQLYRHKYKRIEHQTERAYLFVLADDKKVWIPNDWVAVLNIKSFDVYNWAEPRFQDNINADFIKKVNSKIDREAKRREKIRLNKVIEKDKRKKK